MAISSLVKSFLKRSPLWAGVLVAILAFWIYQGLWATDRYVSEANVVLESPQLTVPSLDVSSLFSGSGSGSGDMLLLRDHLLSVDMLRKVQAELNFRGHYSDPGIDWFSRLAGEDVPIEELHNYYLRYISVELDDYAQVLRISVQAFTPQMANKIAELLLREGEAHMNAMGQRLAEEQVRFLERQVNELYERFEAARRDLIDYQNVHGLVSPEGTIESISEVIASMEGELAKMKAERSALASFQRENSPELVKIEAAIRSMGEQIAQERARLAQQSGGALNTVTAEYQSLELRARFAQESYSAVLAALENTRIEAARKLKQVSVLQSPTLPEYPIEPDRVYNSVVFALIALLLGLIGQMLLLIINDHRD
jgi:capsular polysaccharide transport system permease protein